MRIVGACHGDAAEIVFQAVIGFILDRVADTFLGHARLKAAALNHEPGNHAVEDGAVEKARAGVLEKIGHGLRSLVGIQFQNDGAQVGLQSHGHDIISCHVIWARMVACRAPMNELTVKTRFAPSPTGEVHLGNLRTALFNALYARREQGIFLLRIENTDAARSKPEFEQALMRDLHWLSLDWQEGPEVGGEHAPYHQSARLETYDQYYQALTAESACYPCFCSETQLKLARKAQRTAGQPPRYPGTCAHLSAEEVEKKLAEGGKPTLRFRVPPGQQVEFEDLVRGAQRFAGSDIGDFIIRRSDGTPSFFFTNAIDDALMGVSHVLRGEDHLTNTPRQLMILAALDLPAPVYGHLSLLVGSDGSPLSKRHGSRSVRQLREAGYLPGGILNYLARLGHKYNADHYLDVGELAAAFDLARLSKAPARFDEVQLRYWQKEAVLAASSAELVDWFKQSAEGRQQTADWSAQRLQGLVDVVRDNVEMPADISAWMHRLSVDAPVINDQERILIQAAGEGFFREALVQLEADYEGFKPFSKAVGQAVGVKGKQLFMPLRISLTGVAHGPEMARVWDWLGRDHCRVRLQAALNHCVDGAQTHAETV